MCVVVVKVRGGGKECVGGETQMYVCDEFFELCLVG